MTNAPLPNFDPLDPVQVREAFLEAIADLSKRRDELKQAQARAPKEVKSRRQAEDYVTHIKALKAAKKRVEDERKAEKGKYDACGKVIHAAATNIETDLDKLIDEAEGRLHAYAETDPEATEIRGEYGGKITRIDGIDIEIKNAKEIPPRVLWSFLTHDAIEKALRAWHRNNKERVQRMVDVGEGDKIIKGVRFVSTTKTTVR